MEFACGAYTAKGNIRVRCGWSSLGLVKGAKVEATQFDAEGKKVLVQYGGGSVDWMSLSRFKELFEVRHQS